MGVGECAQWISWNLWATSTCWGWDWVDGHGCDWAVFGQVNGQSDKTGDKMYEIIIWWRFHSLITIWQNSINWPHNYTTKWCGY